MGIPCLASDTLIFRHNDLVWALKRNKINPSGLFFLSPRPFRPETALPHFYLSRCPPPHGFPHPQHQGQNQSNPSSWPAKLQVPATTNPLPPPAWPHILPRPAFSEGWSVTSGQEHGLRTHTLRASAPRKAQLASRGKGCSSRCPESGSAWVGRPRRACHQGPAQPSGPVKGHFYFKLSYCPLMAGESRVTSPTWAAAEVI